MQPTTDFLSYVTTVTAIYRKAIESATSRNQITQPLINPNPMTDSKTVEKIIDKLSNKESTAIRRLFNSHHGGDKSCSACESFYEELAKIFPPPPVLIGDVLEKMWKFGDASLRSNEMFKIWAKCGLDKSLNQIAECGFEEIYITNCCKLSGYHKNKDGSYSCAHCNKPADLNMHEEQLKDPAARELFEFLADIFLT